MADPVICIEFERLKLLLVSAKRRRETAMNRVDLSAAKAASENMNTISDLIFSHALKCGICNGQNHPHGLIAGKRSRSSD